MREPDAIARDRLAWAIRPVIEGRPRERGELVELSGRPTDQRLFDEHYLQRLMPKNRPTPCKHCAKVLVGGENMAVHVAARHGTRPERAPENGTA